MPRYLISFDDGSMDHILEEDWPAVGEAAHAVVREAKAAGVWIFGGGVLRQQASIVATDGTVSLGPVPEPKAVVGGFSIIEVTSREEALVWAAHSQELQMCAGGPRDHVRPGFLRALSDGWTVWPNVRVLPRRMRSVASWRRRSTTRC
jgi:hypothetical protein